MPTGRLSLRLASAADGAAVREVYRPYVETTAISFETAVPTAAEMGRGIRDTLPTYPWLVAERGGRVVGYAYGGRYMERAAYDWTVATSVYCAVDALGQGVGSRLYGGLFSILEAQGFVTAVAGIALPNPASEAIHARFGFRPIGVYPAVGFKDGAWHDVLWLSRPVGPAPPPAHPPPLRSAPDVVADPDLARRFGAC